MYNIHKSLINEWIKSCSHIVFNILLSTYQYPRCVEDAWCELCPEQELERLEREQERTAKEQIVEQDVQPTGFTFGKEKWHYAQK